MAQIELPILARFAAAGEIASLAMVIRTYRRHDASLYHSEVSGMMKNSKLQRAVSRFIHIVGLIFDQMSVLIVSSMREREKKVVLLNVAKYYCLRVISRLPLRRSITD